MEIGKGELLIGEIAAQHKGNLRLHLRLHHVAQRNLRTVATRHIGEQHAVVWLMHAELLLHRERGEADFTAREPPAVLNRARRINRLCGIGPFKIAVRDQGADGFARLARASRLEEQRGGRLDLGLRSCRHGLSSCLRV